MAFLEEFFEKVGFDKIACKNTLHAKSIHLKVKH